MRRVCQEVAQILLKGLQVVHIIDPGIEISHGGEESEIEIRKIGARLCELSLVVLGSECFVAEIQPGQRRCVWKSFDNLTEYRDAIAKIVFFLVIVGVSVAGEIDGFDMLSILRLLNAPQSFAAFSGRSAREVLEDKLGTDGSASLVE
jgi:hypothetical protein